MTHPIPNALCLWLLLFMQTACHSSLPVSRHDLPTRSFTWRGDTLFTAETGNKAARIRLKEQNGALQLTLSPTTSADTSCSIMLSDADSLYLPVGEGKLFSTQDTLWIHHLSGESYSAIADLSMPFIAFSRGLHAYVVVFDHPCRTCIRWSGNRRLRLSIKSEFVSLDSVRQNQMTIYATTNSPVAVARTYQAHIFKQDKHIRTLVQQAETHPNVARLFGAPHFYLWDTSRKAEQIIDEMYANGIRKAWIGFGEWKETPESRHLVEEICRKGYLTGPYDSYHSIHKPGHEEWSTASFRDTTLYDQASIRRQDGSYMSGFKGVGRYLNPIYSMGEVIYRTHKILSTGVPFNSWFIDCDATGEVHDDYTPHHESNKQQNIEARLRRMAYIRDTLQMVIGSEGGNDFACGTISFAHGVDLPTFTWMDKEMKDKESPYFVGAYYSPTEGEVPSVYARQAPVKTRFYDLFLNPTYAVPLYKLVYNPVIVTANHWEWPSLKIREAVKERMLYEISYNAAPLYHLSVKEWNAHKRTIIRHVRIWSRIHEKAIRMPMTDFRYLSDDKQVQQTAFGNDLIITTNYSDKTFRYGSHEIPPRSAWIESDGKSLMYTPQD